MFPNFVDVMAFQSWSWYSFEFVLNTLVFWAYPVRVCWPLSNDFLFFLLGIDDLELSSLSLCFISVTWLNFKWPSKLPVSAHFAKTLLKHNLHLGVALSMGLLYLSGTKPKYFHTFEVVFFFEIQRKIRKFKHQKIQSSRNETVWWGHLTLIKVHSCNKVTNSYYHGFRGMMIMRQYCKLL